MAGASTNTTGRLGFRGTVLQQAEHLRFSLVFLFSGVRKSDMAPQTLDLLMQAFSWSANVLLTGQTPMTDWLGNDVSGGGSTLAGGWRGQVAQ
eukprot:5866852-Pyramimonas_sp.AAC.1